MGCLDGVLEGVFERMEKIILYYYYYYCRRFVVHLVGLKLGGVEQRTRLFPLSQGSEGWREKGSIRIEKLEGRETVVVIES